MDVSICCRIAMEKVAVLPVPTAEECIFNFLQIDYNLANISILKTKKSVNIIYMQGTGEHNR